MINQFATGILAQTLLSEVIEEGLKAAQAKKQDRMKDMNNLIYGFNERVNMAASILASVLPGICAADVIHVFENIDEKEINPWCGIEESDIEYVLKKTRDYRIQQHEKLEKYKDEHS